MIGTSTGNTKRGGEQIFLPLTSRPPERGGRLSAQSHRMGKRGCKSRGDKKRRHSGVPNQQTEKGSPVGWGEGSLFQTDRDIKDFMRLVKGLGVACAG